MRTSSTIWLAARYGFGGQAGEEPWYGAADQEADKDDGHRNTNALSQHFSIDPADVRENRPNRATAAMTAEPMAIPLVMALVVLPTASQVGHDLARFRLQVGHRRCRWRCRR
ncbi:MAG: hypothetical protein R2844_17020 [Caldilineales bacterium]